MGPQWWRAQGWGGRAVGTGWLQHQQAASARRNRVPQVQKQPGCSPARQKGWGWCVLPLLLQPDAGCKRESSRDFASSPPSGEPLGMKGTVEMSWVVWVRMLVRRMGTELVSLALAWRGVTPSCLMLSARGLNALGAELNVSELLTAAVGRGSDCTAVKPARLVRDGQDTHQCHPRCRAKCPGLPHSVRPSPWIFQVGQILCLVLRPAPAQAGGN